MTEFNEVYRHIFENAPDAIFMLNHECIIDCNSKAQEMFGLAKHHIIGRIVSDLSPPRQSCHKLSKEKYLNKIKATISGKSQLFEWVHHHADGKCFKCTIDLTRVTVDGTEGLLVASMRKISQSNRSNCLDIDSELLLEKTFVSLDDAVFIIDSNARNITMCNPAAERIFGYAKLEIIGHNTEFLHISKSMYERFALKLFPALDSSGVFQGEFYMRRKNGEIFPSEHSITQIMDESGSRIAVVSVVRDITKKKGAEKTIKESEARYRTIFEHSPDAVIIVDPLTTGILNFNDLFVSLLGYLPDECSKLQLGDFEALESREETNQHISRILLQGRDEFRSKFHRKDGTLRDVSVAARVIEVTDRKLLYCILRDITLEMQMHESLRKSKELLELAIEGSRAGVWDLKFKSDAPWGTLGDEIYLSPRLKEIIGYKDHEFPNSVNAYQKFIDTKDLKRIKLEMEHHLNGKTTLYEVAYRIRHKDGTDRWIQSRGRIIRDEKGTPVRWSGIDHDITRQIQTKAALQLSEEKYRLLFETMFQGVIYHNQDGTIASANPAAQKLLGLDTDAIISRMTIDPRWQVILEDGSEFPAKTRPSWLALTTGKPQKDVIMGVYNPVEEQYRWISVNAVPLFSGTPSLPVKVYTTFSDITELKKTEDRLRRYSEQLQVLHEIDKAVLGSKEIRIIIVEALQQFRKVMPCRRASIVSFNLDNGTARVLGVDTSVKSTQNEEVRPPLDIFGSLEELAKGKLHIVQDVADANLSVSTIDYLRKEGLNAYVNIPMICQGELLGSFNLGFENPTSFTDPEIEIAKGVADSLAVALQNFQLMSHFKKQEQDLLRLSVHITKTQEAERKRISQELHDEIGQELTAISINLSVIRRDINPIKTPGIELKLAETQDLVERISDQIHDLSLFLRPSLIDDLGLIPALRWLIDRFRTRCNIDIVFNHCGANWNLPEDMKVALFRIVQEALNNVVKHAEATHAQILLELNLNTLYAYIEDNGKGFDSIEVLADDGTKFGIGLLGMKERIVSLNGQFHIESQAEKGTRISLQVPLVDRGNV